MNFFYWGSAMTAVMLVFLMWHAESISPGAASMSIHIILAHTMFLSGIVLGFHYYLVGIFLFLTAALTIFMAGTFGIDLVLMLPLIWLGFYVEKTYLFPTLKRKHDFEVEMKGQQDKSEKNITSNFITYGVQAIFIASCVWCCWIFSDIT